MKMKQFLCFFLLNIVLALFTGGCETPQPTGHENNVDARLVLIQEGWDYYLSPALLDLKAKTDTLHSVTDAFCDQKNGKTLDDVRQAWKEAYKSFKFQEVYNFGPFSAGINTYAKRFDSLILFDPDEVEKYIKLVTDKGKTIGEERFKISKFSSSKRIGFPALEYLLWNTKNPLQPQTQRCHYAKDLARALDETADELYVAWDPKKFDPSTSYKPLRKAPGYYYVLLHPSDKDSRYHYVEDSLQEIINRIWYSLERIDQDRIGRLFGTKGLNLSRVEARYSKIGLETIKATLEGAQKCYVGRDKPVSLSEVVRISKPDLDKEIRDKFDDLIDTVAKLERSTTLIDAAGDTEGKEKLREIQEKVRSLQRLIEIQVIGLLNLHAVGRDADGD